MRITGHQPTAGLTRFRWDVALLGVKNGVNSIFTTPEKFIQSGNFKVLVYWNGRRLRETNDYTVSESGGVGTGFDTVTFLFAKPPVSSSVLTADYIAA